MMGFASLNPSYEVRRSAVPVGWVERSETHRAGRHHRRQPPRPMRAPAPAASRGAAVPVH